ncbi:magnesium transporter [Ectothiorhodospira haloalkaliphila]|uniref:magnesium transporter n=1 Tax=Ectothiorhodospira TaxID=1051 RepID=UPI001EE94CCD|nr:MULTISPECIES: magnesium transporter [Ectothiorhodospira]MCG5496715.1 magnesium transporter [Ectothiorhodospira variabilis]MCG5523424.1 magnesium transporter [Ectothiorhodospira haloalkaliphila]
METTQTISAERFKAHIQSQDQEGLRSLLAPLQDQDMAALAVHLEPEEWAVLVRLLPEERAPDVFSYLTQEQQQRILADLSDEEKTHLLKRSSYDDTAALIDSLPDDHAREVLDLLPDRHQWVIKSLLAYPEESAGRRMTPGFLAVRPHWTLEQALDHLRREFEESETVNVVFVTDEEGRLLGAVKLKDLLVGSPRRRVDSLLREDVVRAQTRMDQEEAAGLIRRYDLEVLPVVDERDILVGIITVDDVMDVATEETTEDFLRMGSVGPIVLNLKDAAMSLLYRKRVGWLVILVFVNLFSGAAIAVYEDAIEAVVALVFFLPLVIATGGNAGTQASTLMVRSLATGDVQLKDGIRLWGKEFMVSIALGITLGLAVWGAGIWLGGPEVGMAVAIAMVLVVIVGSMVGLLLPLLLTRLKLDPATASAPLVTSIADVGGILVYFTVATMVLQLSA